MHMPYISVIITTYNRRNLLPYAIQSVLDQTYTNYEIIVINDCGEDVWDIVESFNSDKIIYLSHIKNSGLPYARNTAINVAKGQVLCYLDDDDLFLAEHLETIVDVFQTTKTQLVYVDSYLVEEEITDTQRMEISRTRPYSKIQYSLSKLLLANFIPVNAWAHHISLLKHTGNFDESLKSYEDWDLFIRLSMASAVMQIHKTTVEVRQRKNLNDNMLSREANNRYMHLKKIHHRYPSNDIDVLLQRQKKHFRMARNRHKNTYATMHMAKYFILLIKKKFILSKSYVSNSIILENRK